jgi:DNA helicase HerA-like ATPase
LNATFSKSPPAEQTKETAKEINTGNFNNLESADFEPYAMNNQEPYKSKHISYYSYEKKILSRIKDSRYDYLFNPGAYKDENSEKDLNNLLNEWIGNDKKLTILDLSGVPFEVLDITIGLITRFIYDSMFWGRFEEYTGKNRPILLAYEEAHTYLNKNDNNSYSKKAVERIFKEGRKFGVGAMVITQRPSEISETILAQVGTLIALRLTNSSDQGIVKSTAPDNLNSLIDLLPSLRIGEAVIVGESIKIPSRVRIKLNNPRPSSEDPKLVENWSKNFEQDEENYKSVVKKIREQKI